MAVIAKNNQKSIEQFVFRKYYDVIYFPKQFTNVIDFWKTSMLYGKVDTNLNAVMLNTNNLKLLKTNNIAQPSQFFALSFVADAFNEMVIEFQRADQFKIIPKSKLNPLRIEKAAVPTLTNYEQTIRSFLDSAFNKRVLKDKVFNLNDFLNEFCLAIQTTSLYLSQTSYLTNNVSTPCVSGLIIELANLNHDEDKLKDKQIKDPNFEFFINTAEKYSFFIDKNAPWRLVFNINTSYALQKMKDNGFNSIDEMFSKAYNTVYKNEWKSLKETLINYYNDNVLSKQKSQLPILNKDGSIEFINKEKEFNVENKYNDLFWIKLYYFVRLKEEDIRIDQTQFENKMNRLISIYNSAGELPALEYINNDTKAFLDGGTNPSYTQIMEVNKKKKMRTSNFIYKL